MNGHSAADGEDEGTVERLVRVAGRRALSDSGTIRLTATKSRL